MITHFTSAASQWFRPATRLLTLAIVLQLANGHASALELGAPFADHAVLQRQAPLRVWGWSKPGTEVAIEFAGQKQSAKASENGKWTITLTPLEASAEPREMTIAEKGGESRTLKDLLVGEVWMASGQSNMQWIAGQSAVNTIIKGFTAKGEKPPIREFKISNMFAAPYPIEHATGAWKVDTYPDYSAIAFAFAHKVYQETGVPVGILNCSFSQTRIEAWVPREGFAAGTEEYTKSIQAKLLESDPTTPEHKKAWGDYYASLEKTLKDNAGRVAAGKPAQAVFASKLPANYSDNRDASWMYNGHMNPVVPYAIRGAIWNQGYANMQDGILYYQNLHSLIRGWRMKWGNPKLPVYFNQFYTCGNQEGGPVITNTAEMRLGTWLARDIPHTGMGIQIDIGGAIHYYQKALSGQRLALHALKNEYGKKDLVVDGPMFKSYTVNGDKLTVEFDHADGGLLVAETLSNSDKKITATCDGLATPKVISNGASQVKHFWLAGEDRVWHRATVQIDGSKAIVSSPGVKSPRGVAYGTRGIGFTPNIYNKALLPTTPFIYYDNKLVTSETWPDKPIKVAGEIPDTSIYGLVYKYRKMPILRTPFRDNAILQADAPITVSGSALVFPGHPPDYTGEAEIRFEFAGVKKTIPVTKDMTEWSVTVPAMPASTEPKTMRVSFHIDGELVHERICNNMIIGDVWYIASPSFEKKEPTFTFEASGQTVRVMTRKSKRATSTAPSRFFISTSTAADNEYASTWDETTNDFVSAIGHRLAKQSGRPTGVIHMTSKGEIPLNSWMKFEHLKDAPSLKADYENLAQMQPGHPLYDANVRRYIGAWQKYWGEFIPQMIATRAVPNGELWGSYPRLDSEVTSEATQTHNVCTYSFMPDSFKGIVFLCGPSFVNEDKGKNFGPELTALANGWIKDFGGKSKFIYTVPGAALAPAITAPAGIQGQSHAIEVTDWPSQKTLPALLDQIIKAVN